MSDTASRYASTKKYCTALLSVQMALLSVYMAFLRWDVVDRRQTLLQELKAGRFIFTRDIQVENVY